LRSFFSPYGDFGTVGVDLGEGWHSKNLQGANKASIERNGLQFHHHVAAQFQVVENRMAHSGVPARMGY
jgi:hypothetical protein